MRKPIALIAAMAVLATTFACDNKPVESEPVGNTKNTVEHEFRTDPDNMETKNLSEPEYLELTEEDFTQVDLFFDVTDAEPPIDIHCVDLSGLDFGQRISPCKKSDGYMDYAYNLGYTDPEWQKHYDDAVKKLAETPCSGMLDDIVYSDGKFFFLINFDDLCGRHDWSIYSYDVKTGSSKELITHSDTKMISTYHALIPWRGRLYYPVSCSDTSVSMRDKATICSLDFEGGNENEELEFEGDVYNMESTKNSLLIDLSDEIEIKSYHWEYDLVTKELSTRDISYSIDDNENTDNEVFCDGVPARITGGIENGKYSPVIIETQYYTLITDIIDYSDIFLWKDKVSIICKDVYNPSKMNTYDLKKRERLKMDVTFDYSGAIQTEDGLLAVSSLIPGSDGYSLESGACLEYFDPLLGTMFQIGTSENCLFEADNDTVYYLTINGKSSRFDEGNRVFVGYSSNKGLPDKLYWFDNKQLIIE